MKRELHTISQAARRYALNTGKRLAEGARSICAGGLRNRVRPGDGPSPSAALAAAVGWAGTPGSAKAEYSGEWGTEYHGLPEGCNSSGREAHSTTSCLNAWWDNSPPASSGVAGGSTFGAQSQCADWGDIFGSC